MVNLEKIALDIQNNIISALESAQNLDVTPEEYLRGRLFYEIQNLLTSGEYNDRFQEVVIDEFKKYVSGTEYVTPSVYRHFTNFVRNTGIELSAEFVDTSPYVSYVDIGMAQFGTIIDWAIAVSSARKILSKNPEIDRYAKAASYYWRHVIYPDEGNLDYTMDTRLSFVPDGAPYLEMIELGTNQSKFPAAYGGFPTPVYGGKSNFTFLIRQRIIRELQEIVQIVESAIRERIGFTNVIEIYKSNGIEMTAKFEEAVARLSKSAAIKILNEIKSSDTEKAISVIINIGKGEYNIIRTKRGRWGLRFNISSVHRRSND